MGVKHKRHHYFLSLGIWEWINSALHRRLTIVELVRGQVGQISLTKSQARWGFESLSILN